MIGDPLLHHTLAFVISLTPILAKSLLNWAEFKYHYLWLERDPFSRFIHIQNIFSKTNQVLNENSPQSDLHWFRSEVFMQGFLCCMEMASECFILEPGYISQYVKNKIFHVGIPKEGKLKIKEGIDNLLSVLKTIPTDGPDIVIPSFEIMPDFIDNLIKLVSHLTRKSLFLQKYLMANDLIYRSENSPDCFKK